MASAAICDAMRASTHAFFFVEKKDCLWNIGTGARLRTRVSRLA
jgi:hypothetical protein